jgi:hypothetical protein
MPCGKRATREAECFDAYCDLSKVIQPTDGSTWCSRRRDSHVNVRLHSLKLAADSLGALRSYLRHDPFTPLHIAISVANAASVASHVTLT